MAVQLLARRLQLAHHHVALLLVNFVYAASFRQCASKLAISLNLRSFALAHQLLDLLRAAQQAAVVGRADASAQLREAHHLQVAHQVALRQLLLHIVDFGVLRHQRLRRAEAVVAEHLRHPYAVYRQALVLNLRRPSLGHLLYHVGVTVALLVQGGNLRRQLALLRPLVGLVERLVVCLPSLLRQQPVVLVAHLAETVQRALRHHDSFVERLHGAEIKRHGEPRQ